MSLFDDAVAVAKMYLGPAAGRFMSRQVNGHLNIKESELAPCHMEELAHWCHTSGLLYISEAKALELSNKIKALGKAKVPPST